MPVDLPATIETAIQYLREGAFQIADELLVRELTDYRRQLETIGLGPASVPKGRAELWLDFMKIVTARLGNPAELEAIINELSKPE